MNPIQFCSCPCVVQKHQYVEGGQALLLVHAIEGDPVAKATVYVEGVKLAPDEAIIKDYSENEGMLEVLVGAGIVEPTGRTVALPHGIVAPICRVLI